MERKPAPYYEVGCMTRDVACSMRSGKLAACCVGLLVPTWERRMHMLQLGRGRR